MNKGEKTKQKIIDASNQLFYQQGYADTAISHIVTKTGLSKGNITYHFKSKKNILENIVAKRLNTIKNNFKLWNNKSKNPKKRLQLFCQSIASESENLSAYGCPMGTLTTEFSKKHTDLYHIVKPMFQLHLEWLTTQFELLEKGTAKATKKAMRLMAQVQGIAVLTHAFKDKTFLNEEIQRIILEIKK